MKVEEELKEIEYHINQLKQVPKDEEGNYCECEDCERIKINILKDMLRIIINLL